MTTAPINKPTLCTEVQYSMVSDRMAIKRQSAESPAIK
jgi:hypothetical protein